MDIQSEAVARAVKEALHSPVQRSRRESLALKVIHDFEMNVIRARAIADPAEADVLSLRHTVVRMLQSLRGAAANNGSSDISEIAGAL